MTDDAVIINHAYIKALSASLGRPMGTLEVTGNDPFTADRKARRAGAEWFAELWHRLGTEPGTHLRRIHYKLLSQAAPILMLNGEPYINTSQCEDVIERTSLDARYLGLVPALIDRRNPEPVIYLPEREDTALIAVSGEESSSAPSLSFDVPRLVLYPPSDLQSHHVEIWCEKSTMNDVLLPLGERYGVNIVTAAGEFSLTNCVDLVKRALESGLPVRILYVSDFDPAGRSMPVAVARKIEHTVRKGMHDDLDIQVRPIVLTLEQCQHYRLPRIPIKETETRGAAFEQRFGEGATELDALEALHPGELRRILEAEIKHYYDITLRRRIADVAGETENELRRINEAVRERHAVALAVLEAERKNHEAALAAFAEKVAATTRQITEDLEAEAPDVDDIDWPEPEGADEDDDPLFDSTRDYVEQIDRYKAFQGKPTEATPRKKPTPVMKACPGCGELVPVIRNDFKGCRKCRDRDTRERNRRSDKRRTARR